MTKILMRRVITQTCVTCLDEVPMHMFTQVRKKNQGTYRTCKKCVDGVQNENLRRIRAGYSFTKKAKMRIAKIINYIGGR